MATTAFGAVSTYAFNKLRKRKEEVVVTGTEHDTVKRISHSSIETIEKLNKSFEGLSEKLIEQRKEFAGKFNELTIKLEEANKQNAILQTQNTELKMQNTQLQKKLDELTAKLDSLIKG